MSIGDLLRYLLIGAVGVVILFFGLKWWGKISAEKRIVRELRTLANPTASFEQEFAEDAKKALFRSMAQLYLAEDKLEKEPGEILDKVFHGKGDGALFPIADGSEKYVDPRETLIREGLLRNFQKCKSFGLFEESANRKLLDEGDPPRITKGPAAGETATVHYIIGAEVSPGMEKLIPNLVIGSAQRDAKPTDLSIQQAKALASSLLRAKLIERDTEERIIAHYDKVGKGEEEERVESGEKEAEPATP